MQKIEITKVLPLYIKYRLNGVGPKVKLRVLEKQSGLIGARLAGAEWSTSDMIVFLDAHCEVDDIYFFTFRFPLRWD